jgi:uncharacterized protein (TIGR02266 family)
MPKSSAGKGTEKRLSARANVRARVDFEIESDDTFVYEYMTNLSRGGIFLSTRNPLEAGTVIKLRFALPENGREIEVNGRVAWVNRFRPDGLNMNPGMGVEFVDLADEDRQAIVRTVKRLAILPD